MNNEFNCYFSYYECWMRYDYSEKSENIFELVCASATQ